MLEHNELLRLIKNRDVDAARALFDRAFWQKTNTTPTWEHLKQALAESHQPMVKLLVTWGAKPTEAEWAAHKEEYDTDHHLSAFKSHIQKLRRAGLDLRNLPDTASHLQTQEPIDLNATYIPKEWKDVLYSFQSMGKNKACIAGGALRDLFNERAVNDVDIFLFTQGSQSKNKKLIRKVFKKAGLGITMDNIREGVFSRKYEVNTSSPYLRTTKGKMTLQAFLETESWDITAGQNKTKYNVVFLNKNVIYRNISHISDVSKEKPNALALRFFDFNLCEISYDGHKVEATNGYKKDVANKTITWDKNCTTSQEHLDKLIKKYPDFTVDPAVISALKLKKVAQQAVKSRSTYRSRFRY